jgi:hypothetical protein
MISRAKQIKGQMRKRMSVCDSESKAALQFYRSRFTATQVQGNTQAHLVRLAAASNEEKQFGP